VTARPRGKVWLVGAGPGDPGLVTLKAAREIATADVLVYDYLAAAPIVALARPDCEKIYVGKKAGEHTVPQHEITALIVRLGNAGKRVVRLKGGDPFVFARGGEEAAELHAAGVPFEIVPGISSALAAPAYAGIPITHRAHNTAFTVATGHEDPTKGWSSLDFSKLANPEQTLVFLMAMSNLGAIVAKLLEHGMPPDLPVAVVREGTKPQQETLVATLGTIVAEVERTRFAAPAIVVIGQVVREREYVRWFDNTPLFGKRVLVTRPARSADEFAARLWEVGAEPVLAPVIAIEPPDDERAADDAVARVRDYAWLAFTSQNGVAAFFDRLVRQGGDARRLGDTRVAAIGPKTADALAAHGVRADYVPERFISEEVAAGVLERTEPGDRVLVYRAQEARDVLPEALRAEWREVDVVAGYKSVTRDDPHIAELAEAADVWTFTSAGIVRAFLANVPGAETMAGEKTVACIGPITAGAAREAGLDVDVIADEYTVEGLVEALSARPALV
jgi:uroporphyrinogen III methyltransferase / synthase